MVWAKRTQVATENRDVPAGVRIAGAWAWRILAVLGVLAVVVGLVILLEDIVIPFLLGIVIAALLVPLSNWLQRHHVPKWAAIVISLVGGIAALAALIWLVVAQIADAYPDLRDQALGQYANLKGLLVSAGLGITDKDISGWFADATTWAQNNSSKILSGVLTAGSGATHLIEGLLILLFTVIFLLIDGKGVWRWVVRIFPKAARPAIDGAGVAGWATLTSFIRVQIFVAFVDAVGIGLGVAICGVPLAIPIAVVVFLGAFVPVVGAVVTGVLAVVVALLFNGWVIALVMVGVVLLVQQIEGHLLQPLVMGSAVKVHPLAVVLGVAAASGLAGIAGAFFAVPFIATVNSMVTAVSSGRWRGLSSSDVEGSLHREKLEQRAEDKRASANASTV
jgi:predicted PurR-regulated permease PerM